MRAAQITEYGGPDVLQTNNNVPQPKVDVGQVLVEVHAASANPFDWKIREGYMKDMIPLSLPATLGGDVAGLVAEVGEGVDGFVVGEEVFGLANAAGGRGSFAEFTPVKATSLAVKPNNVDFQTAAALPLAAVSAYQGLVDHIKLQAGQKVLIQGGAGGIGALAIQIAHQLGAHVITTASTANVDYVKELGADEVIDYSQQDFTTIVHDCDAVFDTVGGETASKSYQVLRSGGILVSMTEAPDEVLMKQYDVQAVHESTAVNPERLTAIKQLVEDGKLQVNIDKVFSLDQAGEALGHLQNDHPRGKVVIQVK